MRTFFFRLLCAVLTSPFLVSASIAAEVLKVVYHVSDLDKVPFVLTNIENHIKGVGGPDKVNIVLVAHGPALKAFEKNSTSPKLLDQLSGLKTGGVEFDACGNTLRSLNLGLGDLAPGFIRVDQGGVVRIAELQHQGYIYIRP
jgi:hypothetical protein